MPIAPNQELRSDPMAFPARYQYPLVYKRLTLCSVQLPVITTG